MNKHIYKIGDECVVIGNRRTSELGEVFLIEEIDNNGSVTSEELVYWYGTHEIVLYKIWNSPVYQLLIANNTDKC